jgi:hypothetical protein
MAEVKHRGESSLSADDRVASSSDSTITSAIGVKMCCVCGADVHGKVRYKDSDGRYWCATCNEADLQRRQPATCPDCSREMLAGDLQDFKGTMICQPCWEKRRQSAKREEGRLRAIEEAADEEERRRHLWKLALITTLVVLAAFGLYMFFSTLTSAP